MGIQNRVAQLDHAGGPVGNDLQAVNLCTALKRCRDLLHPILLRIKNDHLRARLQTRQQSGVIVDRRIDDYQ